MEFYCASHRNSAVSRSVYVLPHIVRYSIESPSGILYYIREVYCSRACMRSSQQAESALLGNIATAATMANDTYGAGIGARRNAIDMIGCSFAPIGRKSIATSRHEELDLHFTPAKAALRFAVLNLCEITLTELLRAIVAGAALRITRSGRYNAGRTIVTFSCWTTSLHTERCTSFEEQTVHGALSEKSTLE